MMALVRVLRECLDSITCFPAFASIVVRCRLQDTESLSSHLIKLRQIVKFMSQLNIPFEYDYLSSAWHQESTGADMEASSGWGVVGLKSERWTFREAVEHSTEAKTF